MILVHTNLLTRYANVRSRRHRVTRASHPVLAFLEGVLLYFPMLGLVPGA